VPPGTQLFHQCFKLILRDREKYAGSEKPLPTFISNFGNNSQVSATNIGSKLERRSATRLVSPEGRAAIDELLKVELGAKDGIISIQVCALCCVCVCICVCLHVSVCAVCLHACLPACVCMQHFLYQEDHPSNMTCICV